MTDEQEPRVRVTDNRLIDPQTGEVRQPSETADASSADSQAETIEAEVIEVEAKVAELTNDLQRMAAEYANYRRRVERERSELRDVVVATVLSDLLPVVDDVDRARQHGELEGAFRTVGEALEGVVTKAGLERFGTEGEPFDPMQHEAVATEHRDDVTTPTVVAVYQPGYRLGGRVLRPARVAVAGTD